METKIVQPWMKGLILSLITITYSIALYLTDLWQNKSLGYISYVVVIGGIIWSCIHYAKQMDGNVTYGNVFAHGFKVTATLIVITVIYTILSIKVIFPEMMDKILEMTARELEKNKDLTDAQAKSALDMTSKFIFPFMIGGIILMYGILGAIASAIGAGVAKKNPQATPFDQQ
jgi:NADH:ubiquinone oxidoreductase subunit 6 (subunit J)